LTEHRPILILLGVLYSGYAAHGWRAALRRLAQDDHARSSLRADDLVASIVHAAACAFGLGVVAWGWLRA
jgi:hypothetical protein